MRVIRWIAAIFLVLYTAANWYATQSVAGACESHPILGWHITVFETDIYPPWGYFLWSEDPMIQQAIPDILNENAMWTTISFFVTAGIAYLLVKKSQKETSHGSASFATFTDIEKADLGEFMSENGGVFKYKETKEKILGIIPWKRKVKEKKNSGVVVGINPYTKKLMLHNGKEHILLMAPTRSGKGINTIIPTGLVWRDSIFFFDPKGELWANTAGFRQKYFHQKVLKFEPLCTDGSGARWNPLAEIEYRTFAEISDVSTIVSVMVKPDGEKKGGGDPFWENSAASLLNGVIMHLMYRHHKEGLPLPCPSDIMSFLSSPDTKVAFQTMQRYPHISAEEFLELEITDEEGNPVLDEFGQPMRRKNPLKEIYGEYIKDFSPFVEELGTVNSVEQIRLLLLARIKEEKEKAAKEGRKFSIKDAVDFKEDEVDPKLRDMSDMKDPWFRLLTHPKVAECASNMLNGADQTRASIMQTAQTALAIYQDPVVQSNMQVSDFAIRDLLDPTREVSLYLVMQVKDIATVRPIARLFVNTLLNKLIRDMKFDSQESGKQKEDAPKAPAPPKQKHEREDSPNGDASQEAAKAGKEDAPKVPAPPDPKPEKEGAPNGDAPQETAEAGQDVPGESASEADSPGETNPRVDLRKKTDIEQTVGDSAKETADEKKAKEPKKEQDPTLHEPKKGGQRLLLMLDEFPQLGNMESVELALAICAGYGIKMCIVCQDVNQLNKAYTKDNSVASNCHVHIYFTPNLDSGGATAEAISKNLGKKTIKTVSHSDGGGIGKGSDSTSSTGRELMTPDEVSKLSTEKEIVFVAGHPPILGNKLRYYLYPQLLKRTKLPCPKISDTVTQVLDYDTLFATHAADQREKDEKRRDVLEAKVLREGYESLQAYMDVQRKEKEKIEQQIVADSAAKNATKGEDDTESQENVRGIIAPAEAEKPEGPGKVGRGPGAPSRRGMPKPANASSRSIREEHAGQYNLWRERQQERQAKKFLEGESGMPQTHSQGHGTNDPKAMPEPMAANAGKPSYSLIGDILDEDD